jgi:LCP family protein required for cell wall assembly
MSQGTAVVPARTRRRWPRRVLLGVNVFLVLFVLASAAAYGYMRLRFAQVKKHPFACNVLRNCGDDDPTRAMNVLLVGSDTRKNISPEERRKFGSESQVGGQRSDTIMVLRIDPAERKAAILSIPRDLGVHISGSRPGRIQKINSAFEAGPESLINTIRESLGIPIDHYAEVDFNGFRGIVDAIGGVTLYFPAPARDKQTGLDVRRAGCVKLDGEGALRYVRSREYQQLENGRWRTDPTADLGRIERQHDFVRRVLAKASHAGRNPATLNSLAGTAVHNVSIDKAFTTKDIFRLVRRFKSLEPDAVDMPSLPTTDARIGGLAVLRLKQPDAGLILDRFAGRKPPPPPAGSSPQSTVLPNTVRVRVLNGSGIDGQAGDVARALQGVNFSVAGTGPADSYRYTASVVRYGRGQLSKAQLLQGYVGGGVQLREDRTLRGVDLVLISGRTFSGIAPPSAAGATTSTAPATRSGNPAQGNAKGAPAQPAC